VDSVHNVVDRGRLSVHGSTVDWDNGGGGGSSGCGLSDMGAHWRSSRRTGRDRATW
jgi:hypothetical protein